MQLRPYQTSAIAQLYEHYQAATKRVVLQIPTGGGKTATCAQIIKDCYGKGHSVLVLAHRTELLTQMQATLARFGISAGIIKAGHPKTPSLVQVASIQTYARRLAAPLQTPRLIVVDECHRLATGTQYQQVLSAHPDAFLLGLTATPIRLDGKGLGDIFEALIHGPQISELVEQGYLVPPSYRVCKSMIEGMSLRARSGDYSQRELDRVAGETLLQGDLVREWHTHAEALQTITFAINCDHSRSIVEAYRAAGIPAAHLDGSTPADERKRILGAFAAGLVRVLCNVGIVTEGFDVPAVACVQLARPTKSVSLYYQMVGRALRPAEGKFEAIVLDHAGCYAEHGNVLTPYHWELTTTKPKEVQPDWIEREAKPVKERVITCEGNEVLITIEYDADRAWFDELLRLKDIAEASRYKPGWVAARLSQRFPVLTLEQRKVVAKVLGYHWKWAERQMEKVS